MFFSSLSANMCLGQKSAPKVLSGAFIEINLKHTGF